MDCPKCSKKLEYLDAPYLSERYFCCKCEIVITIEDIGNMNDPISIETLCTDQDLQHIRKELHSY